VTTLSLRALNRATLDRQLLLGRHPMTARQAVRRLAGLQGQAPLAPYVGLWTRLSAFTPDALSDLLTARTVVRAAVMRGTVHVVDAADFATFRPLFSPLLTAVLDTNFRRGLAGADPAEVARDAAELLTGRTLTRAQRMSKLPASLGDWSGEEFLRIKFTFLEGEALRQRLGEVIDEAAMGKDTTGKPVLRDGLSILFRGVAAAVPQGFRADMLKPDSVLRNERVPIVGVHDVFSGGQQLTAAIVAKPETDRIERIAEHARKSLQPDLAVGRHTGLG